MLLKECISIITKQPQSFPSRAYMWFPYSPREGVGFDSLLLKCELVSWLALANRNSRKWMYNSWKARTERFLSCSSSVLLNHHENKLQANLCRMITGVHYGQPNSLLSSQAYQTCIWGQPRPVRTELTHQPTTNIWTSSNVICWAWTIPTEPPTWHLES